MAVGRFQEVEAGQQEEAGILDGWITSLRGLLHSEVFARTHTRKEDREWVDKRSSDVNAIIDSGGPVLFSDLDDDDTASGPPNLREQVTLLNREISQQVEAHAQRVATVEAVCAEKVRTLESTVQSQSQEVSDLRRAYSDMYSFLTQMRSDASGSGSMPDMPPPPPPPPPPLPASSQTPPPQPDQTTGSPNHDDDTDYV
ncbi:hypothetical protein PIB30_057987 [Stylosanthes scabra]|uniref:PH domain-containing protein n=1 Tax=Stylosanthes scabra TaxID=79078 RepID=A0ABU6VKU1_9FABA|nr:hypothetical protein [Stylosanthes scabra]